MYKKGVIRKYTGKDSYYFVADCVNRIGAKAFLNNLFLERINLSNGVVSIGDNAFAGCSSLRRVDIPAERYRDGGYFFNSCTAFGGHDIERVTITGSLISIGKNAFQDCISLNDIDMPDSVRKIGDRAFADCTGLTCIKIPESVKSIGKNAFIGAKNLEKLNIPDSICDFGFNEMNIRNRAFFNCKLLSDVKIGNRVKRIGAHSFEGCRLIREIIIPPSMKKIECSAFKNCRALESINIPSEVRKIGKNAFAGCPKLTIYCPVGSCAHLYAIQNKINYAIVKTERRY